MSSRSQPFLVAGFLAIVAFVALAVAFAALPTRLTVAVGPRDSDDYKILSQLARHLSAERRSVRLKVKVTDGAASAAAELESGQADLAVIRTDVKLPANGQTVVIMHKNVALLLAPAGTKIKSIPDLAGKSVGIIRGTGPNRRMLQVILAHHGIAETNVKAVLLDGKDLEAAFAEKRIDVVMGVGHVAGPTLADIVATTTRAGAGPPVFLDIPEAEAIAKRLPAFEAIEVLQGSFGGRPPSPAEAISALANSHRLMVRRNVSENTVAALTRLIFTLRPDIAQRVPLANAIEAPDNEKGQVLPVHAGTLAYLEGEERSFFDRYGDWIYLAIMVVSIIGSVGALFIGMARRRRADPQRERLRRVLSILSAARSLESTTALADLHAELDQLVAEALADPEVSDDETRLSALALAISSARSALAERAGELRRTLPRAAE